MTTTNHDQLSPQRTAEPSELMAFAAADYVLFYDIPPQETGSDYKSWYARGQNFIVAYAEVEAGAELTRREQEDEYILLLPDRLSRVEVRTGNEINTIEGNSLVIVPPGRSSIRVVAGGRCVRLLTTRPKICLRSAPTPLPTKNLTRTFRRFSLGRRRLTAIASVRTALMCRKHPVVSDECGDAAHSW